MKTTKLFVLVWVLITVGFSGVFAADQQNALIVDNANLFGGKAQDVQRAAQALQSKGADVHIWTIRSFAGEASSLMEYEEKLEKSFPAWQSANGKRKSNLIVLMMSLTERKTGLYYGSEFGRPLEKNWIRIQTDLMNPKFGRGEFAEGFIAGLDEVTRLVDEHIHPSQVSPSKTVIVQQQAPSKPTDLTGLWTVMKWCLGILTVCIVGFFLIRMFNRRREEWEKKLRAQQRARIEKQNATEKITSIRAAMSDLETLVTAITGVMDEKSAQLLRKKLQKAKDAQAKLASDFSGTGTAAGDPDVDGLMDAQYAAMEDKYKEVTESSSGALSFIRELEEEVRTFRDQAMNASKTLETLNQRAEEVSGVVTALIGKGFKIDEVSKLLNTTLKILQQAKGHLDGKQYEQFAVVTNEVEGQLNSIEERALAIPDLGETIEKRVMDIEAKIPVVVKMIGDAKETFMMITASFVLRSWEAIKGNGSEAENRIKKATATIDVIRKCISMDVQDWSQGQDLVEKAGQWLGEAESLMRSVFSLKENLERAKANVAKEVTDTESDIQKAWDYIKQYDADIRDSLEDDLRQAEKMIKEVKDELKKTMPDYTTAFKRAQEANALADKIYDQAVDERETAERQRRKLSSQQDNVERKISKAREYFEDHDRDVNPESREHLSSAENNFQRAVNCADLNQRSQLMFLAEEAADHAYNVAKDDVENAHRSRNRNSWGSRREYESRDNTVVVVGGYSGEHEAHNDTRGSGGRTSNSDESSGGGGDTTFSIDTGGGGGGDTTFSIDTGGGGGGGDTGW
ncbi:MAG: TPM domain-containing protein [Parcubacteria group bacterium]